MPWRECSVTQERLRFVARLLDGEGLSEVCREFGISRKTGYKIFNRYRDHGLDALCDRSRRPVRYANQLPDQVERLIVDLKRAKPHWGARKIRELLVRKLAGDVRLPAKSTVHAVLDRYGLVQRARGAISACVRHRVSTSNYRNQWADGSGSQRLTLREAEVLDLIMDAASNKEAAQHLGIGRRTIEVHRAHIIAKLGAKNAADLVRIALSKERDQARCNK